jgi:hypothetical protein
MTGFLPNKKLIYEPPSNLRFLCVSIPIFPSPACSVGGYSGIRAVTGAKKRASGAPFQGVHFLRDVPKIPRRCLSFLWTGWTLFPLEE